jgi:hypothetical protein
VPKPADSIEALLSRAEQNPTDSATIAVLLDALSEADDPRGELGAVQSRGAALEALDEALHAKHGAAAYVPDVDRQLSLDKSSGFVDAISITVETKSKRTAKALLESVLAKPAGRMAHTVTLHLSAEQPAKLIKDALACLPVLEQLPALRALDFYVYATNEAAVEIDLAPALAKLALTKLALRGSSAPIKRVLAGTWPKITRLVLAPYSSEPLAPGECNRLFDGKAFPNLAELEADLPEEVLAKLVASPLAGRLKVLDLSGSRLAEKVAAKLVAGKSKLTKLEQLSVNPEELTVKTIRGLRGLCSTVRGLPDEEQLVWAEQKARSYDDDRYEEIEE